MRIYRLKDGRQWPPALDGGFFVLGDPRHGARKHTVENAVRVKSEEEAIALLHKGFSIRVQTSTRPSLVSKNLYVDGKPLS